MCASIEVESGLMPERMIGSDMGAGNSVMVKERGQKKRRRNGDY